MLENQRLINLDGIQNNDETVVLVYGDITEDQRKLLDTVQNDNCRFIILDQDLLSQSMQQMVFYIRNISPNHTEVADKLENQFQILKNTKDISLSSICTDYSEVLLTLSNLFDIFLDIDFFIVINKLGTRDTLLGYLIRHMVNYMIPTLVVQEKLPTIESILEYIPFSSIQKVFTSLNDCVKYLDEVCEGREVKTE